MEKSQFFASFLAFCVHGLERLFCFLGYLWTHFPSLSWLTFWKNPNVSTSLTSCFHIVKMLFSFLEYRQTHFPELLLLKKKRSFFDILNKTECFLDQKYKVLKSPKKSGFWFWSKNGHFSNFFWKQYRAGKCLLRHSRKKKRLSRL